MRQVARDIGYMRFPFQARFFLNVSHSAFPTTFNSSLQLGMGDLF